MVWNADPVAVSFGSLAIRWYGLFFSLAFVFGFQLMRWVFLNEGRKLATLDTLGFYLMLGTILGARLGHVLFYEPGVYLRDPLRILKVWEGGLASHGAVLGVFVAAYLYSRRTKDQPYLWLLDRLALPFTLGGALVRAGNFMNSEIIGTPSSVPWAVVFTRVDLLPRHPAQLYEAIYYLLVFLWLYYLYRRSRGRFPPGLFLGWFLTAVFSGRFLIEFVKERQVVGEAGLVLDFGQLLSIPAILIGLFFLIRALKFSKIK